MKTFVFYTLAKTKGTKPVVLSWMESAAKNKAGERKGAEGLRRWVVLSTRWSS